MCWRGLRVKTTAACVLLTISVTILDSTAFAHGVSESDQAAMEGGSNWDFLVLGARHMVTGYDHLLFLLGVMFFLTRFREIVKFITAFTAGHTITLIAATFAGIQANYFLVDAVIACTVMYKGFDNLDGFRKYIGVRPPNLLGAVFIFGLIHGFGLSTRLQQLPILGEGLLLRIISFNVGVELGQIAALSVMLVVLSLWRHTAAFTKFSGLANSGLIAAGCLLLLMQLHGYSHTQHPDEFGFAEDLHEHSHEHDHESAQEGQHVHEDGSVHDDHEEAASEDQHVHEDGTVHDDHEETAPVGEHVHEDGTTHADHEEGAPEGAPEGFYFDDDGFLRELPKGDSHPESTPEGQHTHEDGSTHDDH